MGSKIILKSQKLKDFIKDMQEVNRNPRGTTGVLDMLEDINTNPTQSIKPKKILYRARIFDGPINTSSRFIGFSEKESFVPPTKLARDLRANYRYIPYLYCSDKEYGAVCEVRPRLGAMVSVAEIIVNDEIKIFDLTYDSKPKGMNRTKDNLCRDLSELFAKPITNEDDVFDYIPTQYIAEFIKNLGYDAMAYKCALSDKSRNIVVFSYKKCKPISSSVFSISAQIIEIQSENDRNAVKEITGDFEDQLRLL